MGKVNVIMSGNMDLISVTISAEQSLQLDQVRDILINVANNLMVQINEQSNETRSAETETGSDTLTCDPGIGESPDLRREQI